MSGVNKSHSKSGAKSTSTRNTPGNTPKQRLTYSSTQKLVTPVTASKPTAENGGRDRVHHQVLPIKSPAVCHRFSPLPWIDGDDYGQKLGSSRVQDRQTKKEIKLQEENKELKSELIYIKSLYKQLIDEVPSEKFDERRVNLLKSQVIQLERQVCLLSWALNARSDMLTEVEGQLHNIKDHLRSMQESCSHELTCDKAGDLMCTVEGTIHYLYKTVETTNPDVLQLPAMFMGKFLKDGRDKAGQLTLLDVCSGKLDHLNLRHVSKLESKLCKLYKQLLCLKELYCHAGSVAPSRTCIAALHSEHIGQPIRERLASHVTTTVSILEEACQDLLSLSVLFPAAPWPPLRKPVRSDLTLDCVISHMPTGLSKKKEQEIHSVLDALMKAVSYNQHMLTLEVKILKEELAFHQKMYELQIDYAESLLTAVSTAYTQFERSTLEMLCKPLESILDRYETLRNTTSEEALREFLTEFKDNADKLSDAVNCLRDHQATTSEGSTALSQFGQHFFDSLNTLTKQCAVQRDTLMTELLNSRTATRENVSKNKEGVQHVHETENLGAPSKDMSNLRLEQDLNLKTSPSER